MQDEPTDDRPTAAPMSAEVGASIIERLNRLADEFLAERVREQSAGGDLTEQQRADLDRIAADLDERAVPFYGVRGGCVLVAERYPVGWVVRCDEHGCEMDARPTDRAEALWLFECDRGEGWRFIRHHLDDSPPPVMVDLSGLKGEVADFIGTEAAGGHPNGADVLVLWRYMLDGTCRPLAVEYSPIADDGGRYDVVVTDEGDGTEYLTFTLQEER